MKKFKTTFVAELYDMIQEDLSAMKEQGSTYDKEMKCDSDSQTLCGQLLVEKLIAKNLIKLYEDIFKYRTLFMKSNRKEFINNCKDRDLPSDITFANFTTQDPLEDLAWEQGYLAGLDDGFNSVASIIKSDEDKLLSLIKY